MSTARRILAGLVGLALVVAGTYVATSSAQRAAADVVATPVGLASGARIVTLPGGDRVRVRTDPTGRLLVNPATPGTPMLTRTLNGDLYAIPLSAMRAQVAGMDLSGYDVSALLHGRKPAVPPAHPDYPMHTVTITVTDDQGQPADGVSLDVMNVDDIDKTPGGGAVNVNDGVAKISVPDGHYSAMLADLTFAGHHHRVPTTLKMAFASFTVSGGPTTAAVDLRSATHLVSVDTPEPADLIDQDIVWCRGSGSLADGQATEWDWGLTGTTKVYLGESSNEAGVQHFYVHDRFESPAGTVQPYVYDVEFPTDGAITGDQHYRVDPADLATVDTGYHSETALNGSVTLFGGLPWEDGLLRASDPVTAPLRRTEYLTGGHGLVYSGDFFGDDTAEDWSSYDRPYSAGQHATLDWAQGPLVPGLPTAGSSFTYFCPACREDDTLSVILSPLTDSEPDHHGQLAPSGAGVVSSSHFQLYQGDTKLVDQDDTSGGDFSVGADPADYRIVYDQTRITPVTRLSTSSHSEWTFGSQHSGSTTVPDNWYCGTTYTQADCSAVSLLSLDYQLPQGLDGTVGTGPEDLTLTVGHSTNLPAPEVTGATVAISYDQGTTWTPVPVARTDAGTFQASWNNAQDSAGKTISLKVTATDASGATVTQTVTDAAAVAG